jgi:hypothetical protein
VAQILHRLGVFTCRDRYPVLAAWGLVMAGGNGSLPGGQAAARAGRP